MQGQSYLVKTVLEKYNARKKTFLVFKDCPGNPLGHSPRCKWVSLIISKNVPYMSLTACLPCKDQLVPTNVRMSDLRISVPT